MTIQTTDPRVAGLVASVGSTCVYANLAAGYCTKLIKFGATATDWVEEHSGGFWGPLVTADPRTAGRAALIGDLCSYVTGGTMTRLLKYGVLNTDWIKLDAPAPSGGGGGLSDGDYGDVIVSGSGTAMVVDAGVVNTTKLGGDITAAGKALLDDASAAAQRTTLGLAAVAASGSAADLGAGTLPAGRMPAHTGDVTTVVGAVATTIAANAVTNAKAAQMAAGTIKGNNTAGAANASDLTAAQVSAMLPTWAAKAATASIANTLTQVVGVTAPANTLKAGTIVRFRAMGLLTNTVAASSSVLTLRINAASLGATIVASWTVALGTTARTNVPFIVEGELLILSVGTGGAGTGQAFGVIVVTVNTATAIAAPTTVVAAAVNVNTTISNVVELDCISGAATTTWNFVTAYIELVQP